MIDEREIDLLARAANRGHPRGADTVWRDAMEQAATARAATRRRVARAGVVMASAAAIAGLVMLPGGGGNDVQVGGGRAAVLSPGLDGWQVQSAVLPEDDAVSRPTSARLSVYESQTGVVVFSGFSTTGDGLAWSVPAGTRPISVTVAGFAGELTEGDNLNELMVLTVEDADGTQARLLGRGLPAEEFLEAAAAALAGNTPAGMRPVFDGPEASGVLGVPVQGRSTQTASTPAGHRVTVLSAPSAFDVDAVAWLSPTTSEVDVDGRAGVLLVVGGERTIAWQVDGFSVAVTSSDATVAELMTAAENVEVGVAGPTDAPDNDDTSATTSTTSQEPTD